ncbi:hypothetical protein SDC9_199099 [bioreactor metagenome]|uniref:Uncharacterized protein n=1 Tax=bioreactor metagenome TaxID=1076179 RepID=A0A645IW87_9ZZZZ
MNDARAVGERNVIVGNDIPALFIGIDGKIKQRLVIKPDKFLSFKGVKLVRAFTQHAFAQRFGHNVFFTVQFIKAICFLGVYAERDVTRQRPRRRRPREQVRFIVRAAQVADHFELDEYGRLLNKLIALGNLMA